MRVKDLSKEGKRRAKKMRKVSVLILGLFLLSGCMRVRTYTIEKPRTDTEIEGNRGYLTGTPDEEPRESRLGDTRKISVVEIEFGKRKPQESQEFVTEEPMVEEDLFFEEETQDIETTSYDLEDIELEGAVKTYVVQKNDTLQKISYKFYGTTRKWKKLFEANQGVIKNPDKLYPGTEIIIPELN